MNPQAAQNYIRTKVLTATPEQLQMLLFDGAIRYCQQARVAILNKTYDKSFQLIDRTQRIVNELITSLKRDVAPELCTNLAALYNFAYRKLTQATVEHRVDALDEALEVLKYQRETWAMLMEKLAQQKAGVAARNIEMPSPDPRMEATISMQG